MTDPAIPSGQRDVVAGKAASVRRIWIFLSLALALGSLTLAAFPLLPQGRVRTFTLILALELCAIPGCAFLIFRRRWGVARRYSVEPVPETETDRDIRWTKNAILTCTIMGLIAICLFAFATVSPFSWRQFARAVGLGFLYAGAFFGIGSLIGFLFGIPRTVNDAKGGTKGSTNAQQAFKTNTNLEEISDWLTKIIVGLGLINLKSVPGLIKSAASYFANFCGQDFCEAAAAGVIIYFSICGFFLGYLMTRLYLTGAFTRAEASGTVDTEDIDEAGKIDTVTIPVEVRPATASGQDVTPP